MRLFGFSLLAFAVLATSPALAQSFDTPSASAVRQPSGDGRTAPLIRDPGARSADWSATTGSSQSFDVKWRGETSEWNFTSASQLVEQSRADAADFQTGGLFETEAAVTRRFGDFRIGAVGYSARSVGDKAGRGPKLGAMKWQGSAAGPIVGYDTKLAGKPATVSLRWYREIDTPGNSGDTVSASFALRF